MNKPLLFGAGFLSGALSLAIGIFIYGSWSPNSDPSGITMFPDKSICIETSPQMRIIQVLQSDMALAIADYSIEDDITSMSIENMSRNMARNAISYAQGNTMVMLLIREDGVGFYDDQRINMKDPECAQQIGTYQYETRDEMMKTVPVVLVE